MKEYNFKRHYDTKTIISLPQQLFSKFSLSIVTVEKSIEELGTDIESTLKDRISTFICTRWLLTGVQI